MRLLGVETVDALGPQHVCRPFSTSVPCDEILTRVDQHPNGRTADLRRPLCSRFFTTCFPGEALGAYDGICWGCRYHPICKYLYYSVYRIIAENFLYCLPKDLLSSIIGLFLMICIN